MLNQQLISAHITPLKEDQTVEEALALMEELEVKQLPVVKDAHFEGIINEDALLEADQNDPISSLRYDVQGLSVKAEEHLFNAASLAASRGLSVIPVVGADDEYVGAIAGEDLLRNMARVTGAGDGGALIVLEIDNASYSFGEISRLVETNDAFITQLNTFLDPSTGKLTVTLRINKTEVSDIVATFQRYDYSVVYFFGEEQYQNELQHNYKNLLNYLQI